MHCLYLPFKDRNDLIIKTFFNWFLFWEYNLQMILHLRSRTTKDKTLKLVCLLSTELRRYYVCNKDGQILTVVSCTKIIRRTFLQSGGFTFLLNSKINTKNLSKTHLVVLKVISLLWIVIMFFIFFRQYKILKSNSLYKYDWIRWRNIVRV